MFNETPIESCPDTGLLRKQINAIIRLADLAKQLIGSALLLTFIVVAGLLFYSFAGDIIVVIRSKTLINQGLLHAFGTLP